MAELREDKGRQASGYEQAAAALQQQVAQLSAELADAGQASAALKEQLAGLRSKRASASEGQVADLLRWGPAAGVTQLGTCMLCRLTSARAAWHCGVQCAYILRSRSQAQLASVSDIKLDLRQQF